MRHLCNSKHRLHYIFRSSHVGDLRSDVSAFGWPLRTSCSIGVRDEPECRCNKNNESPSYSGALGSHQLMMRFGCFRLQADRFHRRRRSGSSRAVSRTGSTDLSTVVLNCDALVHMFDVSSRPGCERPVCGRSDLSPGIPQPRRHSSTSRYPLSLGRRRVPVRAKTVSAAAGVSGFRPEFALDLRLSFAHNAADEAEGSAPDGHGAAAVVPRP